MLESVVKRSEFVYTREYHYTEIIYYYYYFLSVNIEPSETYR